MNKQKIAKAAFAVFAGVTLLLAGFIVFLAATHTKPYAVVTDSMSPALNKGDAVFVRSVNFEALEPGDIVTVNFNDGSGAFTHRIIRIDTEKALLYTKGDNNLSEDPVPSEYARVVGRVWFSLPVIGSVSIALGSRYFLVSAAVIAIIAVSARIVITSRKKVNAGGGKDAA